MGETEEYEYLKQCYEILRSKCPDNDKLVQATEWLEEFYTQPLSIQFHVQFYNESTDQNDRLHAIIGLSKSAKRAWASVSDESKEEVFKILLNMITREPVWINRRNIINIVSITYETEYSPILLGFVRECVEKQNVAYVEIALSLSTLFPEDIAEAVGDATLPDFFFSLIETSFSFEQPEVRLAAIQLISDAAFIDTSAEAHPEYWEHCVLTLDIIANNKILLPRYVSLIISALSQMRIVTDPIPLMGKCLEFFAADPPNEELLMAIHPIILNICHNYKERVSEEEELKTSLIQLYIATAMRKFDGSDELILTNANFFEQTFTEICSESTIQEMWAMCNEVAQEEAGLFVFARTMSATFTVATEFYIDKFEQISSVLRAGISSDSQLLRDACAQSADDFAKCFVFESDELSLGFLEDVQAACQENPSGELLKALASLLDATKKTDEIFDDFFPFLMAIVQQCEVETQAAALQCLSTLAKWSTLKIFEHYGELLEVLIDIMHSTLDALEHLRGPAIECIAVVAVAVGSSFDEYIPDLFPEFIAGLEDPSLVVSCITALEEIISNCIDHQNYMTLGTYFQQILPFISEHAKYDFTEEYEKLDNVEGAPLPQQFAISASSLMLLSALLITDQAFFDSYLHEVLEDCLIQSDSCSPACKIAAMSALANVVKIQNLPPEEVEAEIAEVAGTIAVKQTALGNDIDVAYQSFVMASLVLQGIDITKMEALTTIISQAKAMLEDPATLSKRPLERGRDLFDAINLFLCAVCQSTNGAAQSLSSLMEIFMSFLQSPSLRFRSMALTLFTEMIRFGSDGFPREMMHACLDCAISMARDEIDGSCFSFLDRLALNEPKLLQPYAADAMEIFLTKLDPEKYQKVERFILMRDKCIKCFGTFLLKQIFPEGSYNIAEIIPIALTAMPIQLDFEKTEADRLADFFFWLYKVSEGNFEEQFLRVLVVEFSNHPSIIETHQFSPMKEHKMKKYCVRIYQKLPTAKELVSEFLENDPIRLGNLERNLADINPEEEEVFSMFGPDDGCDEEEEGEEEEIVATNPNGVASSIIEALEEEEEET